MLDEFGLIQHLANGLPDAVKAGADVRIGIGDDAAVLGGPPGEDWLATTDSMVESVHFTAQTMSWKDVGYKCVAASVSDIAAMGGTPRYVLMSLVLPKPSGTPSSLMAMSSAEAGRAGDTEAGRTANAEGLSLENLEALYDGIGECCLLYNCQVVGGNVTSTRGPVVLTSTVLGTVPSGNALLRSGAQPGDLVFVTGPVGGSGAGLRYLSAPQTGLSLPADEAALLRTAHQRPTPQVTAGTILREVGASSCDDISDGLASELNEIAKASGVRLRISRERIPVAPEVRNFARIQGVDPLTYAWYGGEDYQLVGTASPFTFARALTRLQALGVPLTQIGRVEVGDGVVAEGDGKGLEVIEAKGYNHFNSGS